VCHLVPPRDTADAASGTPGPGERVRHGGRRRGGVRRRNRVATRGQCQLTPALMAPRPPRGRANASSRRWPRAVGAD